MSICAIWGAPQTGKTTLVLNLAYAVSRGELSVCLISLCAYSELSAILGVQISEEHSLATALSSSTNLRGTAYKVDELFYVLAAPTSADLSEYSNYSDEQAKALLENAKLTYDVVLVDCPSEPIDLFAAWALNKADTVLLCLGGHISSVFWHRAMKKALDTLIEKTLFVGSEVVEDCDYAALYKHLNCTPEIRIPYIRVASLLQNESRYLYELPGKKGSSYARAINNLYEVIAT